MEIAKFAVSPERGLTKAMPSARDSLNLLSYRVQGGPSGQIAGLG